MSIVVDNQLSEINEDEVLEDISEVTSEVLEVSDQLEESISEPEVPSKFKDKDINDVIESYTQLEKELGRKNNEVGELRKITDDFIKQQIEPAKEKENHKIDLDDLLENPEAVIQKAMDNNPRVAELEKQLQQAKVDDSRKAFETKHTDWVDVNASDDFRRWLGESQVRLDMYTDAHTNFKYDIADELFTTYKDVRGVAKEKAETKAAGNRKKALKATSVERGSSPETPKRVFRRADLIQLKMTNPVKYEAMGDEILLAYQDGRVR